MIGDTIMSKADSKMTDTRGSSCVSKPDKHVSKGILVFYLSTTACCWAQPPIVFVDKDGLHADWSFVESCARKAYPGRAIAGPDYSELLFHQINTCRMMLVARHSGWIEAGRSAADDPYQPAPLSQADDFKTPLECKVSTDRIFLECNVDLSKP